MNWKRWGTGCPSSGIQFCLMSSGKKISMVRSMTSDDMVYRQGPGIRAVGGIAQNTGEEDELS